MSNDILTNTPNSNSLDIDDTVVSQAEETVNSDGIANKPSKKTFAQTAESRQVPKLSKTENDISRDIVTDKRSIPNYLQQLINNRQTDLTNINRRIDIISRQQLGHSEFSKQTRAEKFKTTLSVSGTIATVGIHQHLKETATPYYKRNLSLAYKQAGLIKKISASVVSLGDMIESKLEAIKLNTSASDDKKITLAGRIREQIKSHQAKAVFDYTYGALQPLVKEAALRTLFNPEENKYAYGTKAINRVGDVVSGKKSLAGIFSRNKNEKIQQGLEKTDRFLQRHSDKFEILKDRLQNRSSNHDPIGIGGTDNSAIIKRLDESNYYQRKILETLTGKAVKIPRRPTSASNNLQIPKPVHHNERPQFNTTHTREPKQRQTGSVYRNQQQIGQTYSHVNNPYSLYDQSPQHNNKSRFSNIRNLKNNTEQRLSNIYESYHQLRDRVNLKGRVDQVKNYNYRDAFQHARDYDYKDGYNTSKDYLRHVHNELGMNSFSNIKENVKSTLKDKDLSLFGKAKKIFNNPLMHDIMAIVNTPLMKHLRVFGNTKLGGFLYKNTGLQKLFNSNFAKKLSNSKLINNRFSKRILNASLGDLSIASGPGAMVTNWLMKKYSGFDRKTSKEFKFFKGLNSRYGDLSNVLDNGSNGNIRSDITDMVKDGLLTGVKNHIPNKVRQHIPRMIKDKFNIVDEAPVHEGDSFKSIFGGLLPSKDKPDANESTKQEKSFGSMFGKFLPKKNSIKSEVSDLETKQQPDTHAYSSRILPKSSVPYSNTHDSLSPNHIAINFGKPNIGEPQHNYEHNQEILNQHDPFITGLPQTKTDISPITSKGKLLQPLTGNILPNLHKVKIPDLLHTPITSLLSKATSILPTKNPISLPSISNIGKTLSVHVESISDKVVSELVKSLHIPQLISPHTGLFDDMSSSKSNIHGYINSKIGRGRHLFNGLKDRIKSIDGQPISDFVSNTIKSDNYIDAFGKLRDRVSSSTDAQQHDKIGLFGRLRKSFKDRNLSRIANNNGHTDSDVSSDDKEQLTKHGFLKRFGNRLKRYHDDHKDLDNNRLITYKNRIKESSKNISDRFSSLREQAKSHNRIVKDVNVEHHDVNEAIPSGIGSGLGLLGSLFGGAKDLLFGNGIDLVEDLLDRRKSKGTASVRRKKGLFQKLAQKRRVNKYLRNKLGSGRYAARVGGNIGKTVFSRIIPKTIGLIGSGIRTVGGPVLGAGYTLASKPILGVSKLLGKGAYNLGKGAASGTAKKGLSLAGKYAPKLATGYVRGVGRGYGLLGRGLYNAASIGTKFGGGLAIGSAKGIGNKIIEHTPKIWNKLGHIPEALDARGEARVAKYLAKPASNIAWGAGKTGIHGAALRSASKLANTALSAKNRLHVGSGNLMRIPNAIKGASNMAGSFMDNGASKAFALGAGKTGAKGLALRGIGKVAGGALKLGKGIFSPASLAGMGISASADLLTKKGSTSNRLIKSAGSALSWGATGAMIGSIVPGVGTAIGAAVGAGAGLLVENFDKVKKVGSFFYDSIVGSDTKIDPNTGKVKKRGKHGLINNMYTSMFGSKAKYGPDGNLEAPKWGLFDYVKNVFTGGKTAKEFEKEKKEWKKAKEFDKKDLTKYDVKLAAKESKDKITAINPITGQTEDIGTIDNSQGQNNSTIDSDPAFKEVVKSLPGKLQDLANSDQSVRFTIYSAIKSNPDKKLVAKILERNYKEGISGKSYSRLVFDELTALALNTTGKDKDKKVSNIASARTYNEDLQSGAIKVATVQSANNALGIATSPIPKGQAGSDMPFDMSKIKPARVGKNLKQNQQTMINAALKLGIPHNAALAMTANTSGESLNDPSNTTGDNGRAQAMVQWHPERALAIKARFKKFPAEMTIAEQTEAMWWEICNNKFYRNTKRTLLDPNATPEQMVNALVRNYEIPSNPDAQVVKRIAFLKSIQNDSSNLDKKSTANDNSPSSNSGVSPVTGQSTKTSGDSGIGSPPSSDGFDKTTATSTDSSTSATVGDKIKSTTLADEVSSVTNNASKYGGKSATSGVAGDKADKLGKIASSISSTKSSGQCAKSVRQFLQKAGYNIQTGLGSAYMYANGPLDQAGFSQVPAGSDNRPGDIIVYGRSKSHPHGHIQVFNGTNWVSDFKQKSISPYKDNLPYTKWRDTGETSKTANDNTPNAPASNVIDMGKYNQNNNTSTETASGLKPPQLPISSPTPSQSQIEQTQNIQDFTTKAMNASRSVPSSSMDNDIHKDLLQQGVDATINIGSKLDQTNSLLTQLLNRSGSNTAATQQPQQTNNTNNAQQQQSSRNNMNPLIDIKIGQRRM